MNCLKAVILLWTGIIAFNASVTAYQIDGNSMRACKLTYCGGLLQSIEIYYVDKINGGPLKDLFDYLQMPGDIGPIKRLKIPYSRMPCDGVTQEIELPVKKLLENKDGEYRFPPPEK